MVGFSCSLGLRCLGFFIEGAGAGLFFGPRSLLGTVGKAFSLPWIGPALNSFSSMHGQSPKQALRPVQGLICISPPTWTGFKKAFSPAHGFFFYLAKYP